MQKTTLLLAVALAFSASSWGQDVKINGTGVSRRPIKRRFTQRKSAGHCPVAERYASGGAGEIHRRGGGSELTAADGLRR